MQCYARIWIDFRRFPDAPPPWPRVQNSMAMEEMWQWKNAEARVYSCFSSSYNTLSRLDMCFVTREVLVRVMHVRYLSMAISDHSPLLISMSMTQSQGYLLWRLSPLWLKEECFERSTATDIAHFWSENKGEVPLGTTWAAFKATLHGSISGLIKQLKSFLSLQPL